MCWACDADAWPPLAIVDVCDSCWAKEDHRATTVNIVDPSKFALAALAGARFQHTAIGARPSTLSKKAGFLGRAQSFCFRDCGFECCTDETSMCPESILLYIIHLRMTGGNDLLLGPVLASTIAKDINVFHAWCEYMMARHRTFITDTTLCPSIKEALRFAKDNCVIRKSGRIAPELSAVRSFVKAMIACSATDVNAKTYGLAALIVPLSFLRPLAAAHVWIDPVYTATDERHTYMSPPMVMARPDRVLFFEDDDGAAALRILPTPGTEKNAVRGPATKLNPHDACTISTTRFLTN
jgi:hypothetical protein